MLREHDTKDVLTVLQIFTR